MRGSTPTWAALPLLLRRPHAEGSRFHNENPHGRGVGQPAPPFDALPDVPLARQHFGGVKTNRRWQVLDKHYEPLPGLYAAGELTGMAGGHMNGKAGLEGTMLGPALFSGRVAGGWAAYEAGYGKEFASKADRR